VSNTFAGEGASRNSGGAESGVAVINCAGGDDGGLAVNYAAAKVLKVELW
jgi:hypothetical protein